MTEDQSCHGNGPDHCCMVAGQVCPFLEMDTVPGRRWVCGLRRKLGSWGAVHRDPGYLQHVKPAWDRAGVKDCGDFGPAEQQCCWGQYDPTDEVSAATALPRQGKGLPFDAG